MPLDFMLNQLMRWNHLKQRRKAAACLHFTWTGFVSVSPNKKMRRVATFAFMMVLPVSALAGNLPPVQTVFIILMENHNWSDIKGSADAPYINNTLLPMASWCEQYASPLSPSLPNYLWLEAGTNFGINDDNDPSVNHQASTNHLVTLLNNAGISWKSYQEDISGTYVPLTDTNAYAVRHDPCVYFDDVTGTNDPNYSYGIAHIRPYGELASDLASNTVARYNFITPDLCDDMHDSCAPLNNPVRQGDDWLSREIPKILNSPAYQNGGAVFITWDESSGGDVPIGMIVLSPVARGGGYFNNIPYSHSSTLRTIEEIFGVSPLLGDAANATDLSDLFASLVISSPVKNPGGFEMTIISANVGKTNFIQASTDLATWASISTNVNLTNIFSVTDAGVTNFDRRFYRVLQIP
jgi:phosphatidylinositol-3-phosphatase